MKLSLKEYMEQVETGAVLNEMGQQNLDIKQQPGAYSITDPQTHTNITTTDPATVQAAKTGKLQIGKVLETDDGDPEWYDDDLKRKMRLATLKHYKENQPEDFDSVRDQMAKKGYEFDDEELNEMFFFPDTRTRSEKSSDANKPSDILGRRPEGGIARHGDEFKHMKRGGNATMGKFDTSTKFDREYYGLGGPEGVLPEEEMMEVAPPGMEDVVMALKKQYPDQEGKAYAIAWSQYNKKHGKNKADESMMESREMMPRQALYESTLDEILMTHPYEHKQCQEGWGMDQSLYEALMDHYFKEGRIPRSVWHGPEHELREFVEECYGQDTGMVLDEDGMPTQPAHYSSPNEYFNQTGRSLEEMHDDMLDERRVDNYDGMSGIERVKAMKAGTRRYSLDPTTKASIGMMKNKMAGNSNMNGEVDPISQVVGNNTFNETEIGETMYESKRDYSAKKAAAGKDIGKPGKNFAKIAAKAGKEYGSKAAGERVAGAVLKNLRKESVDEAQEMDESALQAYFGDKKYGEKGMDELRALGRKHVGKKKMDAAKARLKKNPKNEDTQMEAWNRQFEQVLNEGQSVSISLGQENMPDSVTVTANDHDAHELIKLLQNAGMGGVVGAAKDIAQATHDGASSMMSVNTEPQDQGSIEVVDFDNAQQGLDGAGHDDSGDSALSFIKKMMSQATGNAASGAESEVLHQDDEEDREETDEGAGVMHFKKEQAEKAGKDHFELGGKQYPVKEESESEEDQHAERAGKKVTKDIEYDEDHDGEEDEKAEKAGEKVTKDIEYDDKKDKKEKKDKVDEGEWDGTGMADMAAAVAQDGQDRESAETEKETAMSEGHEHACMECGTPMMEGEHECMECGYMEEGHQTCDECGMYESECECDDDHGHEMLDEWANQVNTKNGVGKPEDNQFNTEMDYMMKLLSGGLNNQKVDDTTLPHTRVRTDRKLAESTSMVDLKKLAGLR